MGRSKAWGGVGENRGETGGSMDVEVWLQIEGRLSRLKKGSEMEKTEFIGRREGKGGGRRREGGRGEGR